MQVYKNCYGGSPLVGFCNLLGVGISPVSQKTDVNSKCIIGGSHYSLIRLYNALCGQSSHNNELLVHSPSSKINCCFYFTLDSLGKMKQYLQYE